MTVTPLARESGGRISREFDSTARCGRGGACSSPARISPICLRRAGRRGRGSLRSARPSARRAGKSFGNSSSKAWSWRCSAGCWALLWRPGVATCSSRSRRRATAFSGNALDGWVLAFSSALSFVTSVLFGLWPAWHTSRADMQLALKSGGHGSSDAPRRATLARTAHRRRSRADAGAPEHGRAGFEEFRQCPCRSRSASIRATVALRAGRSAEPSYSDEKKLLNFSAGARGEAVSAARRGECRAIASNPPLMTGWQTSSCRKECPSRSRVSCLGGNGGRDATAIFKRSKRRCCAAERSRRTDTKDAPPVIDRRSAVRGSIFPRPGRRRETHSDVTPAKRVSANIGLSSAWCRT